MKADTSRIIAEIDNRIVISKIKKGLQDIKEGNVYTKEQAKEKLAKWLK